MSRLCWKIHHRNNYLLHPTTREKAERWENNQEVTLNAFFTRFTKALLLERVRKISFISRSFRFGFSDRFSSLYIFIPKLFSSFSYSFLLHIQFLSFSSFLISSFSPDFSFFSFLFLFCWLVLPVGLRIR